MNTVAEHWDLIAAGVATISACVGVPFAAMTFVLKGLRDDQRQRDSFFDLRFQAVGDDIRTLETSVDQIRRDFTPREDWTREAMLARRQLDRLTELMARIDAELEQSRGLASQFLRATNAIIQLTERLAAAPPRGIHREPSEPQAMRGESS